MAKKKASRKAVSKQPKQQKEKPDLLDYLAALILVLTERGIMRWFSSGEDFLSHISVISQKDGPLQILVGDVKAWTRKANQADPAFEKKLYKLARKAAQPNIEKEAVELEQKAAKLRQQAKRQGRRP